MRKEKSGQGCFEYAVVLLGVFLSLVGLFFFSQNSPGVIPYFVFFLWAIVIGSLGYTFWDEYKKELVRDGLERGTVGKKIKYVVASVFLMAATTVMAVAMNLIFELGSGPGMRF